MTLAVGSTHHDGAEGRHGLVEITGDLSARPVDDEVLVEQLREPIRRALGSARGSFVVRIEPREQVGEIRVRIVGRSVSLQLSFGRDETEPGYVAGIVKDAVARFGL